MTNSSILIFNVTRINYTLMYRNTSEVSKLVSRVFMRQYIHIFIISIDE